MKLRTSLLTAGLAILLVATAGALTIVYLGERALEEQAFAQLRSIRETKAGQIENEISQFLSNLGVLAESRAAQTGLSELSSAFAELGEPIDQDELNGYYTNEFAPRVVGTDHGAGGALRFLPRTDSGRKLQDLYIANNPAPVGEKDRQSDAQDGSRYSEIHAGIHPFFRRALNSFGAYDIFLVDLDGTIVYSVFKEIDVGTNLAEGPLERSGLADAWRASVEGGEVAVTDFEPYLPSYNAPAAFAARGVYGADGDRLGTVAMQAPVDRINAVMTSNLLWSEVGLGDSGETYLVADDFTMRNDSRFLIEDPENYFAAIRRVESAGTVDRIRAFGSTIGLQTVDTVGTRDALSGNAGERIFPDYRGVPVLSSYRRLDLGDSGLSWVIMSEIDEAEAFAAARGLFRTAIAGVTIGGAVLIALVVVGSARITRPLRDLEEETEVVEKFDFTGAEPYDTGKIARIAARQDEIGDLAGAFSRMTTVLGENIRNRTEVEAELNVAAELQRSMLPLTFPSFPEHLEFQIHARLIPAKEIGGDFFEHGFVDRDRFFFTVGDVSGKGVPAALFMAAIKTLIRSGAMQGEEPGPLLTRINAELSRENPEMMFATIWLGVFDLTTGVVTYTNAGHNPPAKLAGHRATSWLEDLHGPMVGPIPGVAYSQSTLQLEPDDLLLIYSDGVTEAMAPDEQLYGDKRLAELLSGAANLVSDEVTSLVVDDVLRWEAGSVRSDDVTVMAFRYVAARHAVSLEVALPMTSARREGDLSGIISHDLSSTNDRLAEYMRRNGVPAEVVQRLQTVVDEILANIAMHSSASKIAARSWVETNKVTLIVSDDGEPYDPFAVPDAEPDVDLALEDRPIGGLGLHLIRNLVSSVRHECLGGRNVLTVVCMFDEEGRPRGDAVRKGLNV